MNIQEQHVDKIAEMLKETATKIWNFAELGLEEYKSSELLAEICRKEGFKVEMGIAGMPTAFVARWQSGSPVIGYLAEYDALPGLSQKISLEQEPLKEGKPGHGCGHNLLGVGALGAAIALKRSLEESGSSGSVYFFGCPAEETITAKGYMVRDGFFDDVDAVFDWHPADINMINMRTTLACDSIEYHFKGRAAHAASNPDWGRSAVKAVELMNAGVNYMREHIHSDARIHYVITDGGGEPNVVPDKGAAWYYIRSPRRSQVDALTERVNKCAEGAALMTETKLEIKVIDKCYNMIPNKVLSQVVLDEFRETGTFKPTDEEWNYIEGLRSTITDDQVEDALREYHMPTDYDGVMHGEVLDLEKEGQVAPGTTDAADVSWKAPLAHARVACKPIGLPGHTWQAVSAFGSGVGMAGMLIASKVLARSGWRLIENPHLAEEARAELDTHLKKEPYKPVLDPELQPPLPGH